MIIKHAQTYLQAYKHGVIMVGKHRIEGQTEHFLTGQE